MHYQDRCPNCSQPRTAEVTPEAATITCAHCGYSQSHSPEAFHEGQPTACLGCGNRDLWRQKDFPQSLGLVMVGLAAVLSSIAWAYHYPVYALAILVVFGLLDMLLYWIMPDVLVCYRCQARHGVGVAHGQFGAYDHQLGERYRQERLRLEQPASQR